MNKFLTMFLTLLSHCVSIGSRHKGIVLSCSLVLSLLCVHPATSQASLQSDQADASEQVLEMPSTCNRGPSGAPAELTVLNGVVSNSPILAEINGFAKSAGVTGGLNGKLAIVTSTEDYGRGEAAIPGSLRQIVKQAAHDQTPTWVVFSAGLPSPSVIFLKEPLHIPSNMTVDGSCSNIAIEGLAHTGLFYIISSHNVLIDRLKFRKTNYVSGLPNADLGTAIRVGGLFDGVAILHNELSECGDGCIDTTTGPHRKIPNKARLTVAFNYIHDHDKTMLFGTHSCAEQGNACVPNYDCPDPHLFMTLEGNVFLRDAQRNPRAYGCVELHAFDNYIAFQPHARPNAKPSESYGIFVSNGAEALIEHNVFVPLDRKKNYAIWTPELPGVKATPLDKPGSIRLEGGPQAPSWALAAFRNPQAVPNPAYQLTMVDLEVLPPPAALACVTTRAGRSGSASWQSSLCGPLQNFP